MATPDPVLAEAAKPTRRGGPSADPEAGPAERRRRRRLQRNAKPRAAVHARDVALIVSGGLRSFISSSNWKTWGQHVVGPLKAAGAHVDTFLCTSTPSDGSRADTCGSAAGLPAHVVKALNVRRWLAREGADFEPALWTCSLGALGCLNATAAAWAARPATAPSRAIAKHLFSRGLAGSTPTLDVRAKGEWPPPHAGAARPARDQTAHL